MINTAGIAADPCDLSASDNYGDVRKIGNLVDGVNFSSDDSNIWLAPFINPKIKGDSNLGRSKNRMFIEFGRPISISCIRFWNYSKTPTRGVREIEIYLDDALIWTGVLRMANNRAPYDTSLLFTGSSMTLDRISGPSPYYVVENQPIAYSNEGAVNLIFLTF